MSWLYNKNKIIIDLKNYKNKSYKGKTPYYNDQRNIFMRVDGFVQKRPFRFYKNKTFQENCIL